MWAHEHGPASDGLPYRDAEKELGIELEADARRSFEHLVDIEILEKIDQPGTPNRYTVAEWRDGNEAFVMGEVSEAAREGTENLIDDMQENDPAEGDDAPAMADGGGTTIRSVVADEFNVAPDAVETTLRKSDPVDRLNDAVAAIRDADDVEIGEGYGEIKFINPPKHYRLTEEAVRLYRLEEDW
jgi:hypothetical protein